MHLILLCRIRRSTVPYTNIPLQHVENTDFATISLGPTELNDFNVIIIEAKILSVCQSRVMHRI